MLREHKADPNHTMTYCTVNYSCNAHGEYVTQRPTVQSAIVSPVGDDFGVVGEVDGEEGVLPVRQAQGRSHVHEADDVLAVGADQEHCVVTGTVKQALRRQSTDLDHNY